MIRRRPPNSERFVPFVSFVLNQGCVEPPPPGMNFCSRCP
jgi:hypothetical protein